MTVMGSQDDVTLGELARRITRVEVAVEKLDEKMDAGDLERRRQRLVVAVAAIGAIGDLVAVLATHVK